MGCPPRASKIMQLAGREKWDPQTEANLGVESLFFLLLHSFTCRSQKFNGTLTREFGSSGPLLRFHRGLKMAKMAQKRRLGCLANDPLPYQ